MRGVLTVTILGSGTSTGVPVPGCSCAVCTSDDPQNVRTRCSVLLTHGGKNILIDTATDLRQQVLREKIGHIDAVFYTHTHADHIHGIDDLRTFNIVSGQAIPIFGSPETLAVIRRNFGYIFDAELEPGYRPRLETHQIDGPFDLFGLTVQPLPLQHGSGMSLGYKVGSFAYLVDCNDIPEETAPLLRDIEILVIDALRFRPHTSHFNIAQALEVARSLGARRTFLTHLSHDVDHSRHTALLPAGVELAYDGQRFEVDLPR
jgi:phosphoribosyl 1,2-cyclic phosphate phosphodiesterase